VALLETILNENIRDGLTRKDLLIFINNERLSARELAREAVNWRYNRHLSTEEIAKETGIAVTQVREHEKLGFQMLHLILSTELL
jgi:DNA-directed RNA polymerase specialized sigma24 family protein